MQGEPGMPRLLGIGLLAAALFSVTFILNRAMSLAGGNWAWSAALRGYGVFYTGICYAADHAPGWIVAATWQCTILATPLVLRGFGVRVPLHGVAFALVIALGILILNAQRIATGIAPAQVMQGVLPVMIAAIAYPVGNQLVNRARHDGGHASATLADPAAAVLLLTLGSLVTAPPLPGAGQLLSTAVIAVVAGGCATTLFLHARNLSADAWRIAAVDATQSGEVAFALVGEMLLLGAAAPDLFGWLGLVAVVGGLAGFSLRNTR